MPKDANFGPSPLGSFARCVRASLPRLGYLALYQGRLIKHDPVTHLVDVLPDDADVPGMQGVPFRLGLPGAAVTSLPQGTTVMVGWSEGDPAKPYCCLPGGGEHVGSMSISTDQLTLGGTAGALPAARQSDPVTLTLLPSDILAIAAAMLATGVFTPSGSSPSPPPAPIPLSQQQIVSGSSVVKIK